MLEIFKWNIFSLASSFERLVLWSRQLFLQLLKYTTYPPLPKRQSVTSFSTGFRLKHRNHHLLKNVLKKVQKYIFRLCLNKKVVTQYPFLESKHGILQGNLPQTLYIIFCVTSLYYFDLAGDANIVQLCIWCSSYILFLISILLTSH